MHCSCVAAKIAFYNYITPERQCQVRFSTFLYISENIYEKLVFVCCVEDFLFAFLFVVCFGGCYAASFLVVGYGACFW